MFKPSVSDEDLYRLGEKLGIKLAGLGRSEIRERVMEAQRLVYAYKVGWVAVISASASVLSALSALAMFLR